MVAGDFEVIPSHQTPFVAGSTVLPDRDGAEQLIVLFKATFDLGEGAAPAVSPEQDPIVAADRHRGDAATTSIAAPAEHAAPLPLGTDVFLVGEAVAPAPGTRELAVSFRVGSVRKEARVFGARAWHGGALGVASFSGPEPFERVALVYENAFGGEDTSPEDRAHWEREARNPVGRGFRAKRSRTPWERTLLPNLEDPRALIARLDDRPQPIAFGPIGRHWEPRIRYVGTYDEAWLRDRMPLLPADFDDRFFHAAPPDQIVTGFVRGGEEVEVRGCTRSGQLGFSLPELRPHVAVHFFMRDAEVALRCESVVVDTSRMKLVMLYRGLVPLHGDVLDILELDVVMEGGS